MIDDNFLNKNRLVNKVEDFIAQPEISHQPHRQVKKKFFIAIIILLLIGFVIANIMVFFPQEQKEQIQQQVNEQQTNQNPASQQQKKQPAILPKQLSTEAETKAYIINQLSNDVWLINLDKETIIKKMTVGSFPTDGFADKDGLYITNTKDNTISVIDRLEEDVTETIPVGEMPQGIAAIGGEIFVVNTRGDTISVINKKTKEKKEIEQLKHPTLMVANAARTRLYLASADSNELTIINPFIRSVIKNIKVGTVPNSVAVSGDELFAVTTNKDSNDISVVPLKLQKEAHRIPVGITPVHAAMTPDNQLVFVANKDSNNIAVVSLNTINVVKKIDIDAPTHVAIINDKAYVTSYTKNVIYIIDINKLKIIGSIPVGIGPVSIVIKENL